MERQDLDAINKSFNKSRGSGMKTFLLTNNEYMAAMMDGLRDDVKEYKKQVESSRKIIVDEARNFILSLSIFTQEERQIILKKFDFDVK